MEQLTAPVKGFKVFKPDWTCRDKQYTCPGEFKEDGNSRKRADLRKEGGETQCSQTY